MRAAGLDAEIEKATEFADYESSEDKIGWKQPKFRPATVDGSKIWMYLISNKSIPSLKPLSIIMKRTRSP
jgi:hypothetical protein